MALDVGNQTNESSTETPTLLCVERAHVQQCQSGARGLGNKLVRAVA